MKFKLFILIFLCSFVTKAELDEKIYIHGQIGNAFDKEKVRVIDSHNQTYFLPKSVFPRDFKFKQGAAFNVEITIQQFKDLEIKKVNK